MRQGLGPYFLLGIFLFGVVIFVFWVVLRRRKIKNFMSDLPMLLKAQKHQTLTKSSQPLPWFEGVLDGQGYWVSFQKFVSSGVGSKQILRTEFVIITDLKSDSPKVVYDQLHNKIAHFADPRCVTADKKTPTQQGFFCKRLMVAPYSEIFADQQTPLNSDNRWIILMTVLFEPDIEYLKKWIKTVCDAGGDKVL